MVQLTSVHDYWKTHSFDYMDLRWQSNLCLLICCHMVYSAYKLTKHGDNIQPLHTSFPIWNQSFVPCLVLTVLPDPGIEPRSPALQTDALLSEPPGKKADQVVWQSSLFQNFLQFAVIHTIKGFGVVTKPEVHVFLELSCFFDDPMDVGNLISGSYAFSKSSLNIWKFSVGILLKPGFENFEHYFASV